MSEQDKTILRLQLKVRYTEALLKEAQELYMEAEERLSEVQSKLEKEEQYTYYDGWKDCYKGLYEGSHTQGFDKGYVAGYDDGRIDGIRSERYVRGCNCKCAGPVEPQVEADEKWTHVIAERARTSARRDGE